MSYSYQTNHKKKIVEQMPPYRQYIGMAGMYMRHTIAPRIFEQHQQRNNEAMYSADNSTGNTQFIGNGGVARRMKQ
jgi:hypothetical protein